MITRNQFIEFIKTAGMQKQALLGGQAMWAAAARSLSKGQYLRAFKTLVGTKARTVARRDALYNALERMHAPRPIPRSEYSVFDKQYEAVRRLTRRYDRRVQDIENIRHNVQQLLPEGTRITPILDNPALEKVHKMYYDSAKNRLTDWQNKAKADDILKRMNDIFL